MIDSLEESVSMVDVSSLHGHGGTTVWYSSVLIICGAPCTYSMYICDVITVISKVEVQEHLYTSADWFTYSRTQGYSRVVRRLEIDGLMKTLRIRNYPSPC